MTIAAAVLKRLLAERPADREAVQTLKLAVARERGAARLPSNGELLALLDAGAEPALARLLQRKPMRTAAGVAPVAVMTSPAPCPHGTCAYCPGGVAHDTPQSYTGHEPAARRAIQHGFDAQAQVAARLAQYTRNGHPTDKVDLIVMGGTFTARTREYQEQFLRGAFAALNRAPSPSLSEALAANAAAPHRCVGLTLETRPGECTAAAVAQMRSLGATRVEIGVQCLDDAVLAGVGRQQTAAEVAEATRHLKAAGLKVCYHLMPGLPGMTPATDRRDFVRLFAEPAFQPDSLKLYPTMLVKGAALAADPGDFVPYDTATAARVVADLMELVPRWVRIQRIQRDIPRDRIVAGVMHSNLRQLARTELAERGGMCRCIHCREVWRDEVDTNAAKLVEYRYAASGGEERFLAYEADGRLLAYLRLRFDERATVRELKGTGPATPLGEHGEEVQHRGFGARLMAHAEARAADYTTLRATHGAGTREYYRRLGYEPVGGHVVKRL